MKKLLSLLLALALLVGGCLTAAASEVEELQEEPAGELKGELLAEEEKPVAEETPHFSEGYIRIKAGTQIYTKASTKKVLGTVTADSYAWAKIEKTAKDPANDWLKIVFDTKKGEAVTAFVKVKAIQTLTDKAQASLRKKLAKAKARELDGGILVPKANYKKAEEASAKVTEKKPAKKTETEPAKKETKKDKKDNKDKKTAKEKKPAEEEKPAAEENPHFSEGYIRIKAGTRIYAKASTKKVLGTVTANSYAWAKIEKTAKNPANDWLKIVFDTKKGEEVTAFVKVKAIQTLTDKAQASLRKKLAKAKARELDGGILVPKAKYKKAEEASAKKTEKKPAKKTETKTAKKENKKDKKESTVVSDGAVKSNNTLSRPKITNLTQKNSAVTIQWSVVYGADSYGVYAKQGTSGSWKRITTVYGEDNTSYTHKKTVNRSGSGYTMYYKVRAFNDWDETSRYSAPKKIIRLASPGTVRLSKHSTSEDKVLVRWQKVHGAKNYYIYYSTDGDTYQYKKVSKSKSKTVITAPGTKKTEVYVVAAKDSFRSAKTATKQIKPYWYRVLLVGNYDYSAAGEDSLPGNRYDVLAMERIFGAQSNVVTTVYNGSASTILYELANTFQGTSPNTICVFMYSGHGYISYGSWSGTLACTDADASYITPATLKSYFDYYGSNHNVILLGSCGSGGFIDENGKKQKDMDAAAFNKSFIDAFKKAAVSNAGEFRDTGYTVIAAAAAHKEGWCSWWTNSYNNVVNGGTDIMRALARGAGYDYCDMNGNNAGTCSKYADSNGDGKVSAYEAYSYAYGRVHEYYEHDNAYYPSIGHVKSDVQFWSTESSLIVFQ